MNRHPPGTHSMADLARDPTPHLILCAEFRFYERGDLRAVPVTVFNTPALRVILASQGQQ